MQRTFRAILLGVALCLGTAVYAVPTLETDQKNTSIYDSYQDKNDTPVSNQDFDESQLQEEQIESTTNQLTLAQRMTRVENQMKNIQQMAANEQIQYLQQEVQTLRGQLEVQANILKKLNQSRSSSDGQDNNDSDSMKKETPVSIEKITDSSGETKEAFNTSSQNDFLQDQKSYEAAYNLILQKKYSQAISALSSYLKIHPNGHYIVNAHYWLGELYLIENNVTSAVQEFKLIIKDFPNSAKYADAMLKLGLVYYDNGDVIKAKQQLQQVIAKFPNTAVARLASERLNQIKLHANEMT